MNSTDTPYANLAPEVVLDAVAAVGLLPDGRLLALNSFENRVYQVGLEDASPLVAKFYRPNRWNEAALLEEHAFALELAEAELPIVAPLEFSGRTLLKHAGFYYALYPRRGGRAPELESPDQLAWMGRLLARIHGIGARAPFRVRDAVNVANFVRTPAQAVLASTLLPNVHQQRYRTNIETLATLLDQRFTAIAPVKQLRLHGDCHIGNVLWTDTGPHFVDLDDARMGPAVQDLWMLAPSRIAIDYLLEGYSEFRDFDYRELTLIEPLRIMRQVHWAAWVVTRWHDPAFPRAFPFIGEAHWWDQHLADLTEAIMKLNATDE